MSDSELLDELDEKHERDRERRFERIERWVQFIRENPPEVWGQQQNDLVDSQLKSARESGLDAAHYRRVEEAGRDHSE